MSYKHGQARKGKRTSEYHIWEGILQRCENPKNKDYADYGGRGIKVCEKWHKFENFYADVGDRPEGMTFDRMVLPSSSFSTVMARRDK
jgi:hypothetical protein